MRKREYRPNLESIITDETNEGSIAAYGREIPNATIEIIIAELTEAIVMHKEMSAPEVGRHNLQTVKVENPSIRPRGGQKHI